MIGAIAAADTTPPARRSVRVNHTAAALLVGDGSLLPTCCYCEQSHVSGSCTTVSSSEAWKRSFSRVADAMYASTDDTLQGIADPFSGVLVVVGDIMQVFAPVLLQTVTTTVYPVDRPAIRVDIRLILDSSSQKSHILARLRECLRLPNEQMQALSIKTFGPDFKKVETCDIVKLGFKVISRTELELTLYTVPMICEQLTGQPINYAVEYFPFYQGST